jgi:WD40 repeat protein
VCLQWINKPQRNRITADFAGLHSQVTCLAISPDAAIIALGFKSSQVHLLDAGTGEVLRELTANGHTDGVTCVSFSGDGLRIATGSHDAQLLIWDAVTGSRLALFDAHTGSVTAALYVDHTESSGGAAGGSKKAAGGARRRGNRTVVSASMEGDIRISEEKTRTTRVEGAGEVMDMVYEQIWSKDFIASPVLCLAYSQATEALVGGQVSTGMAGAEAPRSLSLFLLNWPPRRGLCSSLALRAMATSRSGTPTHQTSA